LVSKPEQVMVASGIVDALTWTEEPDARDAFAALLGPLRLLGGRVDDRLPALFRESVAAAEEITEALGVQVRQAVELIVQAFSEAAADAKRRGEPSPLPDDGDAIYAAVVTVMMRVVFLLFAEERGLLPQSELFTEAYGLVGQLDQLRARVNDEGGEESLESTFGVWHRLLATSRLLYEGSSFEDVRMPAYGGSLFQPGRFPFLGARGERGTLALPVNDRVMLHVLDAVQLATVKNERRPISFRDIDVEQIGYIYEGLLGHTCTFSSETTVGLIGARGSEPEIPLSELCELNGGDLASAAAAKAVAGRILASVKATQPSCKPASPTAMTKAIQAGDSALDATRALLAVTADEDLQARLRPWLGVIRRDLRNRPLVVPAGGLLVVETPSRKNAGAHYTPRSLAEEVVLHALEPLAYSPGPYQTPDRDTWVLKSPEDLLELKVADIACGSGAFLVAAARYLAARLVEAYAKAGVDRGSPHEQQVDALRKVVASCLYGADINPMAIEMCKLSLWLVSLDPKLPFSFVDDKVLVGNSLLGITDLAQLRALHIDGSVTAAASLFDIDTDGPIRRAITIRRALATEIDNDDPSRSAKRKAQLIDEQNAVLGDLHRWADGVIAAGLRVGGKPGKKLDEAYENLRAAVELDAGGDGSALDDIIDIGLTPTVETDYHRWRPLHWALEVPDVMEHGGFDAIVGNPPFLGGKKLSGAIGGNVRNLLVHALAGGTKGSADVVAYFLLRARSLLGSRGNLGLIATNTIAQGDSREVGLDRIVGAGFTLTRATQSRKWPSATANLEYAAIWGTSGKVDSESIRVADGGPVRAISTLLEGEGRVTGAPDRLGDNEGLAFQGCIVGLNLVVEPQQARDWIDAASSNIDVLFPFINGEDLNSRPHGSASRWVIDFYPRTWSEATEYELPMAQARRLAIPTALGSEPENESWWRFHRPRPALRKAIRGLDEVLAIALVSKTVMPVRVANGQVFSHKLAVFATDSFSQQALLSSSVHQGWAIKYGSTMRADLNYSPSDVFETFPRPAPTPDLERLGRTLDVERREIMLRRQLGLTKLYNLVNDPAVDDADDPDVARLRQIHVELDEVVMAAYEWSDVPLDHGFHSYRQMLRWTVCPAARVEILDRLLEENHRRAAAEAAAAPLKLPSGRRRPWEDDDD
jgi:Eco57I restriction-modification methylase